MSPAAGDRTPLMNRQGEFLPDVRWGVSRGLRGTIIVWFFALLLRLVVGDVAYVEMGIPITAVVVAALIGGVGGGVTVGLLRPLTTSVTGSAWLGLGVGALWGCAFFLTARPDLRGMQVAVFIGCYSIVGLLIGVATRVKVTQRG